MKKANVLKEVFNLTIETFGNRITLKIRTDKKGSYIEYNTFNNYEDFKNVLNDLTIASSFQAEILLKYLRMTKKTKSFKNKII